MTTFGEIRSMLHSPTTDAARIEAWEELLKTLMKEFRTREEEVSEEWLPYVMGVLDQQWPDEARVAPRDWVNKLARGLDPHPLMPLVRAIDVRRKPNPHFISMCQGEGFEWVRHMTFGGQRLKLASVEALAEAETFATHPKLRFTLDATALTKAATGAQDHLNAIDLSDRRKGWWLGMLGGLAFNFLLATTLLIIVLIWRGYV